MDAYLYKKQSVLQLLDDFMAFIQTNAAEDVAVIDALGNASEHIKQKKFLVLVCGESQQGKSSLINALLNQPDLFPQGQNTATNLVSMISFGLQEKFVVTLGEPGREVRKEIRREELAQYTGEQHSQHNYENERLLSIELPNEMLHDGLVLVDTPDVGGLYRQHTELTYTFLPLAEAVLFVSDAHSPLHMKELNFVQMMARHCQNIIHVVTKTDNAVDYDTIVESNRKKLSYVLNRPENDIQVIPLSSKMKLHFLQSNDLDDLELSNFQALEQALQKLLGKRESLLLSHGLNLLRLALVQVAAPFEAQAQALEQHTEGEIQEIERKWAEAKRRVHELGDNKSAWHIHLERGMAELRAQAWSDLNHGFMQVRKKLGAYLDDAEQLKSPLTIATEIEQDVYEHVMHLENEVQRNADALLSEIEDQTTLSLNVKFTELLSRPQGTTALLELPQLTKTEFTDSVLLSLREGMSRAGRTATEVGETGAEVGKVVEFISSLLLQQELKGTGGTMGRMVGGLIGGIGGFAFGFVDQMKQISVGDRQQTREDTKRIVEQFIAQSEETCQTSLKEGLDTLAAQMLEAFTGQLRLGEEICERTLVTLQAARNLTQREQLVQKNKLQLLFHEIELLKSRFEELEKTVA